MVSLISTSFVALLPAVAEAAEGDLRLVAQSFNVAADGSLTATIAVPAKLAETDLSTAVIAVAVAQRVDKREDLVPIISRTLSRTDDTVAISPACCAGPGPGELTFSIPLEVAEVRPDALSIPRAGLYPVTIAVQREGRILSTVLTFIHRLPAAGEEVDDAERLSVGLAIGTHSAVHLDSKGTTSLDERSTIDEMTKLADTLDALNVNATPSTVRVEPEVLNGLQQLDPSLFARLIESLQFHQVVAEPQWPIDPSAAADAGQGPLYTRWLRDGSGTPRAPRARTIDHHHVDDLRRRADRWGRRGAAVRPRRRTDGDDTPALRQPRGLHRSLQRLQRRTGLSTATEQPGLRCRCRGPLDFAIAG